jgi:7-keto-8-aminopelargonate synthetase-like enzyme
MASNKKDKDISGKYFSDMQKAFNVLSQETVKAVTTPQDSEIEKLQSFTDSIWEEAGRYMKLYHLELEDPVLNGRTVTVQSKQLINFASCSYLGLEMDERLKRGAIESIERYGTQFSSSSSYLSLPLYTELRKKYEQIFGAEVIVSPSTTLGHLSVIPTIVSNRDAIVMDKQVHNSVQMAVKIAVANGAKSFTVPHNDMLALKKKVERLSKIYRHVWYMADGIYSMYGDVAPIEEIEKLRDTVTNLYIYIDDAHGIGWTGKHGRGFALEALKRLDKTIVLASNNKCFAGGGGCIILNDKTLYTQIRKFGQPLIFSGPLQPPLLGTCLAASDIFLSSEITMLQEKLLKKIRYRNELFKEYGLPVHGPQETPISFVCIGNHKRVGEIFYRLFQDGYFVNCAIFPVVSVNRNGIRFTTTVHQSDEDIASFLKCLSKHIRDVLERDGMTVNDIYDLFKLPLFVE